MDQGPGPTPAGAAARPLTEGARPLPILPIHRYTTSANVNDGRLAARASVAAKTVRRTQGPEETSDQLLRIHSAVPPSRLPSHLMVPGAGAVPVRAPRVNDKRVDEATGQRKRFASAIQPAWARKSPSVAEVLPLLYLHGLSSGDFVPALEQFLDSTAGPSAATVTRLTAQWRDEAAAFAGSPWDACAAGR